jgi:DNA-binding SARP family transcriptional activator
LLNAVTPRFAVGLCGPEAYNLWRRIRYRYLPATMTVDRTLVYHSRFRACLREQLEIRYADELPQLRRRHAGLLLDLGMFEEAVQILLDLGDVDEATLVAERAAPGLIARADWSLMTRWFEQFGPERVEAHPLLQGAQLRCLYGTRRITEMIAKIQELHASQLLGKIAKADPGVVSYLGWALQWRPAEALELLATYQGDFRAEGVRFELQAVSGRDPVAVPAGKNWSDMERLVSWGLLVQGRLPDLMPMLPNENDWPPVNFYRTPHPLLGLVWQGEVGRARELLDQVPSAVREGAHTDLWFFHEAWVRWAEGDLPAALEAARAAVAHSSRTGFGWEPCFDTVVGFFLVLLGQTDDARCVLGESLRRSTAARNRAYAEWALTFEGLACLMDGEPADAVRRLRRAYDGMRRARRTLMMPLAGVYLADAEYQLGNEARSYELAREAHDAAEQMGALFVLQRGLENVPNVLERQIAHDDEDHRWRRIQLLRRSPLSPTTSRESTTRTVSPTGGHTLEIQTFGDNADLIVDGQPAGVKRLKTIEMAAFLALHPGGVDRKRLQARLFPETDQRHGGNYYRQIVHKLRLSTGISLDRSPSGMVRWPDGWFVDCADQRFERLTREAAQLTGHDRLARLESALQIPQGAYLPDSDLEWVEERRFELDVLRSDATGEAAQLALSLGRMELAREFAERAVADDIYSEPAYRTLMAVEAAVGPPGAVMLVYRRLTDALAELHLEPDARTVALVQRLRAS